MLYDVIVVTHKLVADYQGLLTEIRNTSEPVNVILTGQPESASCNRNYGLDQSRADIFIMMDDDISGLYPGWLTDLTEPLKDKDIILSSARMIKETGEVGNQMGAGIPNDDHGVYDTTASGFRGYKRVMTACFAMKRTELRFDEGFIGSGYEDTDFCNQISERYPDKRIVITNKCKVIHHNEMKNQGGEYWKHNKAYYLSKWPDDASVINQQDWTGHG